MSSPDTPPQSPAADAASPPTGPLPVDAAAPAPAPAGEVAGEARASGAHEHHEEAPAGEPAANGHGSEGPEGPEESEESEGPGGAAGEASGPAQAEGTGEKKRRRRRRRKKPGSGAGPAVAGQGAEGQAAPEGGEAAAAVEESHEQPSSSGEKSEKKRKKEKKGPPRERPPVNGGDIVFGKILEITDDAILVDIPGKARAIFDRLEMLIPEDDGTRHAPAPAAAEAAPEAEAAPAPEAASEAAPAPEAEAAPEPAAAPEPEPAPEPAPEPEPEPEPEPAPESPSEAATASEAAPEAPPAERKDPKVPRVILEVGADFIGVVHNDGARGGLVVLTHHPHRAEAAKPAVEKAFNEKTTILGLVTGVIKGGLEVDVEGLRAFAPGSHVDLRLGADLSHLVAKRLAFTVTQYAKRGRDIVLSRRAMLEEEAKQARSEALSKLKVGEEIEGTVRSVVSFGAFVDVGGIEGLVPLQEMSHNRADGPSDIFKAGEPTRVKVLKIDDRGKVWLSHKATMPDPWQEVARKYAMGTRHTGKVARIQPFGAFIELESGIDGLIHLADLSIKRIESPSDVVKVGDAIEVVVSHLDPSSRKIGLHPALQGDAANETPQRVQPHKPLKVKVVNIESGGLVVRALGVTGRNARGYIPAGGTGTPRGTELRKAFSIGQELDAKVMELDPRRGEIKLSIKALSEEQERSAYQQYRQQLKAEARFTFGDLLAKKTQK